MIHRWLFLLLLSLPTALWANESPPAPAPIFDAAQQQWLADHPVLRAGVVLQTPYAQLDRRLHRLTGANVEMMHTLAALMGVLIPMTLFKLDRDPAMGASVMITAVTDSGGFFIFLGLATLFLL